MFFRLYKTRLKCLMKNYRILFWTFAIPLLLSAVFYLGFNRMFAEDNINTVPVAVVPESAGEWEELVQVLKKEKTAKENPIFQVSSCSPEEAGELLKQDRIAGYIRYDSDKNPVLYVLENGLEQTLIKSSLDRYEQWKKTVSKGTTVKTGDLSPSLTELEIHDFVKEGRFADKAVNYLPFYSFLALACILGACWGFYEMIHIQADQSLLGIKYEIAPVHKQLVLFSNITAGVTVHFLSVLLLAGIMGLILDVKLGGKPWMLLLTCFLGSLCSINAGAMLCVSIRANRKVREAVLKLFLIGEVVLSGVAVADVKEIIYINVPFLPLVNPFFLITDAFYTLAYYNGYGKFFLDLFLLFFLTVIFGFLTVFHIRRKEYASI